VKKEDMVQSWRVSHKDELDKTLDVLIKIRDDESQAAKNRIDAGRAIARMLGALAPEKETEAKAKERSAPKLKDELEQGLEEVLAKL